jgi:L-iditol 2-dehydrogenase
MKAAYLKAPFEFEIRELALREPSDDEILVKVRACGICGTDLQSAASDARQWQPFGHEIAGTVEKAGRHVTNVSPGDRVVLESGTFDRFSSHSRNGRVDLDNTGPNYWMKGPMGFAEYLIAPKETAVVFAGLSFAEASLVEPLGVALDLVYTADLRLNDDVLVIGLGPIGLMALRLAKAMGARKIYGAQRSHSTRRIELARAFGADEIIYTDRQDIREFAYPRGGVDRVMITAPPALIPPALELTNVGGVVAFLGIEHGPGGKITFDANDFHFKKLQLRASFASPALYFPRCIELLQSGLIEARALITQTFPLERIAEAMKSLWEDKARSVKSVMVAD